MITTLIICVKQLVAHQTLFFLMLRNSDSYNVYMEYKVKNRFVDILYTSVLGEVSYVIELKYISKTKSEEDSNLLADTIVAVDKQVKKDIELLGDVKGISIVFVGKKCVYKNII